MKNIYRLGFGVLFLALVWIAFVNYTNTRTTTMEIRVAGQVDEVRIFQKGQPGTPIAVFQTSGKDSTYSLDLRNTAKSNFLFTGAPAQYTFIIIKNGVSSPPETMCCATGLVHQAGELTIRDLDSWEVSHP